MKMPPNSSPPPADGLVLPARSSLGREAWVGVFVLLGMAAVLTVLLLFTKPSFFRGRYTLTTLVPDAAGVRHGDPVQIKGVVVGRVSGFDIARDAVRVHLELERRYQVPVDSTVHIEPEGLLGGAVARIEPGHAQEEAHQGAVLSGTSHHGALDQVNHLAAESGDVAARVQALLSDQTIQNVKSGTEQLAQLLQQLSEMTSQQREHVERIGKSLDVAARRIERIATGPDIQRSLDRVDSTTREMQATAESLRRTSESLDAVLGRIRQGHGTLGMLSADESLYLNANGAVLSLGASAAELRRLVEDIRLHPGRYVHVSVF